MVEPLDVFAVNGDSQEWLGSAETLKNALEVAVKHGRGSYFVFSHQTRYKTFYEVTSDGNISIRFTSCMITA